MLYTSLGSRSPFIRHARLALQMRQLQPSRSQGESWSKDFAYWALLDEMLSFILMIAFANSLLGNRMIDRIADRIASDVVEDTCSQRNTEV